MCVILSPQAAPLYPKSTHLKSPPRSNKYGIQQMFYICLVYGAEPFLISICSLFLKTLVYSLFHNLL